jgi:uncharacterized protein (TIGR02246 family)
MKCNLLAVLCSLLFFGAVQTGTFAESVKPAVLSPVQKTKQNSAKTKSVMDSRQAIREVLDSQVDAWNHGNLEAFMDGYWRSPNLTFFSGATITKGWEPTLLRYRQRYQGTGKDMGKLEFNDLNIDLLDPRVAVVTGKYQLTMADGKQPHGIFTLLFKKTPEGWRIVHDHTSTE